MDVYLLGADFDRIEVIDKFESLVWTERYQAYGDFRLDVKESNYLRSSLKFAMYLETSESNHPMILERVERPRQEVGSNLLKCRGRGLSSFLKLRNNKNQVLRDAETVNGQASNIMRYMVNRYCVTAATAGAVNVIPNFDAVDTALGPVMRLALERGDLYSIVQSIAFVSGLGFIMRREDDTNKIIFQATQGIDRTAPGALYREYSTDGESLTTPTSFQSIEGWKNHARVLGKKVGVDVYAPGTLSSVSGWNRRTIVVDANDIGTPVGYEPGEGDPPPTTIAQDQEDLRERGRSVLREQQNRYQMLVSGDIPTHNWNETYYGLGDIVWVKDNEGVKSKMRISEQIWSLDRDGEKRTPTFEEYYTE